MPHPADRAPAARTQPPRAAQRVAQDAAPVKRTTNVFRPGESGEARARSDAGTGFNCFAALIPFRVSLPSLAVES